MNIPYLLGFLRTRGCYMYFVAFQLIVIVGLVTYDLIAFLDQNTAMFTEPVIIFIEIAITVLFLLEVIFRLLSQGKDFFKNVWNVVDFTNLILIVILFLVTICYSHGLGRDQDIQIIPAILMAIRYAIQIVRGIVGFKQSQEIKEASMLDFEFTKEWNPEEKSNRKISLVIY